MLDGCAYSTLLLRSLVSNKPTCKKNNKERKKTTHTHPFLTEIRNARTCLEFNRAKMFFNRLSNATYLSTLYLNLNPPFKTCCLAAHVPGTHASQTRWKKNENFMDRNASLSPELLVTHPYPQVSCFRQSAALALTLTGKF